MTEQEIIDVVTHYKNSGMIEVKHKDGHDWSVCGDPKWSFQTHDYRIKPEKKTRLMTAEELKGKWLKSCHDDGRLYLVSAIWSPLVFLSGWDSLSNECWIDINDLVSDGFKLEDGSSLEVEVEGE